MHTVMGCSVWSVQSTSGEAKMNKETSDQLMRFIKQSDTARLESDSIGCLNGTVETRGGTSLSYPGISGLFRRGH